MRDKMHSPESRAATVVELIRDRVKQNPKYYQIFIEALKANQLANADILEQLKGKYESLSKGEYMYIIVGFLQALWYNTCSLIPGVFLCTTAWEWHWDEAIYII